MKSLFQSFLLLLASSSDKELAQQVQFLKVENEILRTKLPKRIQVTAKEKNRLLKFGKGLGKAIHELITIVTPRTFLRWVSAEKENGTAKKSDESKKVGRPKTNDEIRELVLKLARENSWGYTRILGELKKLGITDICRSTVVNILKEAGLDPNPKRGEGTWSEFMTRHAKTLWACDFFQKKIWTMQGFVDYFLLFFIHVGSRRVYLAGITPNPTDTWVTQQARNIAVIFQDQANKPTHLLRDHDSKFTDRFDAIFKSEDVEVKKVGPRAPNMNAHIERWIQSLRVECLDQFIVFGEDHLRYLVTTYIDQYYNVCRPHQSLSNLPLSGQAETAPGNWKSAEVECDTSLGGLLKSYRWKKAA